MIGRPIGEDRDDLRFVGELGNVCAYVKVAEDAGEIRSKDDALENATANGTA